jgi:hypothetical protein
MQLINMIMTKIADVKKVEYEFPPNADAMVIMIKKKVPSCEEEAYCDDVIAQEEASILKKITDNEEEDCTCCECNNLLARVECLEEDVNIHEDIFDEVYHKLHHMEELVAWQDEMVKKLITKIGTLETRMNMPMNDGVIKALADRVCELEKLNPTRNPLEKTKLEWSNSTKGFCDF